MQVAYSPKPLTINPNAYFKKQLIIIERRLT